MANSFQFRFRGTPYRFRFHVGSFLLCLILVGLLCKLGMWQLYRYHYKKELQLTFSQRLASSPRDLLQVLRTGETLQFQKVVIKGHYVNELSMVLQNQFYHDQLGYDVLTPVKLSGDTKLLLIDRGWLPVSPTGTIPPIKNEKGEKSIQGYLKVLDEHQFILGKNIMNPTVSPITMQKIDIDEVSRLTHHSFYPFILRLSPTESNGFTRDWTITSVMPERHMGYAVQWFAMAFVLFIAYLIFCCERMNHAK